LEKIEKNERRLEILCSRVDNLEKLEVLDTKSLRDNNSSNELEDLSTEQPGDNGNSQENRVNTILV
jgi:hypothetical protein